MSYEAKVVYGEIRSFNDETYSCQIVANSGGLDREGEILAPTPTKFGEGCVYSTYMAKHPVILFGHQDRAFPIGKATKTWAEEDVGVIQDVTLAAHIPEHVNARIAWGLIRGEFLKAASVRFQPLKLRDFVEGTAERDEEGLSRIYDEWELLETSFVNIPCDPGAGLRANRDARPDLLKALSLVSSGTEITELVEEMVKSGAFGLEESGVLKRVVPYQGFPLADEGMRWSFTAVDGNALLEAGGWPAFRKVHTFQNTEADAETKGAYKLPHHKIINGSVSTVWRGVAAAMSRLLSTASIPAGDRRACYNHLRKHYAQFEKPVPDFREYGELEARFAAFGLEIPPDALRQIELRLHQDLGMQITTIVADELVKLGLDPAGVGMQAFLRGDFADTLRDVPPEEPEYLIDEETDKRLMEILAPVAGARTE